MGLAPVERQVGAQPTAPLPTASADAFGAAAARGLTELGASVDQIRSNEANAKAGKDLSEYRIQAQKDAQAARDAAAAGGEGHEQAVRTRLQAGTQAVLDGIHDPRVRQRAATELMAFNENVITREALWQGAQRVAKLGSDETQARTTGLARIATAGSVDDLTPIIAEELKSGHARIDAYAGISADDREKMGRDWDQQIQRATLGTVTRLNPQMAEAMLAKGAFDSLPADELEQGYRAIGVEQRRQQAAVEHRDVLGKAQVREANATVIARIGAGEDVPDDELKAAESRALAIGDTSGAVTFQGQRIKLGVNRQTQDWTPSQFDGRIQALRAKGDKRSGGEDVELKQLEGIAPGRRAEFQRDPGSWAARLGSPPPSLDIADPRTIAARRAWQASTSQAAHVPVPFLQPNEVAGLQAQLAIGPKARVEVAGALAQLGGMTAVQAARQVAPTDPLLARMVLLHPADRAGLANGAEARKANPALIDGKAGAEARALFLTRVGPATMLMGQGDVAAAEDVARNLYADYAAQNGLQSFEPARWNAFIHRALGGTRDGDGQWHGGIGTYNGQNVLLPPKLMQRQFDAVLARVDWRDEDAPHWRDGRPMRPADVRKFVPVARPDGRYEFHGPGNVVLQGTNGGIWSLDIGHLAERYRP